jgi:23S rRNA pseudouridine1911/1915/1917 synthase
MALEILYEDNHLLAVNKPAGLLTQPSGTDQDSLETQCKAWIKEKYKKPGNVFLEAVHRLDKPVSGVVLFAKTSKALSRLNASMRSKAIKKTYYAYVEKLPPRSEETLEHFLIHDDYQARIAPEGKLSRLHYRTLRKNGSHAVLEIELETGRYHQIRAQLAAIGCPIAGDYKYGAQEAYPYEGIGLHNQRMEITHPITNQGLTFEAPAAGGCWGGAGSSSI